MTQPKLTLADIALYNRTPKVTLIPNGFRIYCFKCNIIMGPGTLVLKYDGATYVHKECPKTPLKTYAPHKYGGK